MCQSSYSTSILAAQNMSSQGPICSEIFTALQTDARPIPGLVVNISRPEEGDWEGGDTTLAAVIGAGTSKICSQKDSYEHDSASWSAWSYKGSEHQGLQQKVVGGCQT